MKQTIQHRFQQVITIAFIGMAVLLTACSSKEEKFVFNTPQEALTACHKELSKLRAVKTADIDKLSALTNTWLELQDSTLNCFMRDSTVKSNTVIAADFFEVVDSFRTEILRLALAQKRTLQDIVKLKVATADGRERVLASKDFMKAMEFYSRMDGEKLYPDMNTTLSEYEKLLSSSPFKNMKELCDFIQKEDKCFRSLLVFLKDVPQEKLQVITNKTSALFDRLYNNMDNLENDADGGVRLYLTMRFNRRIMQNAEACRKDIEADIVLTEKQAANYRWMIIQPFMTIDNYSMAFLTEEQVKTLIGLADKLPRLLAYIDGKDYDRSPVTETQKLNDVLSEYFLKSYLKSIL